MFNITSLTGHYIRYPFINGQSSVCECMPPQDIITAEFVGPEVRKDGYKRLILSRIRPCPGWHSGESTST